MIRIGRLCLVVAASFVSAIALAGSGYTVNGVDLDSIFAPYHSGWPQAGATGFHVGVTDLNARYAPLSTGSAAAATGYKAGGADLNTIFAGSGTTGLAISTQPSVVSGSAAAGNPSGTVTSNSTSCAATHGNSSAYSYSWHIASGSASPTAGSSSTSAVTATVNAGTTNTGTWYCTITDGVTSANTNTVGWSLQNTTPPYNFQITAGTSGTAVGYANNAVDGTFGTLNSNTSGAALVASYNNSNVVVRITGATVQSYLTSITLNGVTLTGASASIFSYDATHNLGVWTWTSSTFGLVSGNVYNGLLNHT